MAEDVRRFCGLPITAPCGPAAVVVKEGTPATEIVLEAERADLIVMGTHGRTGITHLVMGSVAEHVVRTARCPVLTVRDAPAAESLPAMASLRTAAV